MDKLKSVMQKVMQFLFEARAELKKVTWPTPKQTLASTAVVIVISVVVSIYLGVIDFGLVKLIKFILG